MVSAPIPENEQARLQALKSYKILDTEAEREFDDITSLASSLLGMPISLISLIDENRQWFKSQVGLEVKETSRDLAFCAHAILNPNDLFEVPDTSKDKRFKDNPLVTGDPNIKSYAGAPIVDKDGHGLGTLCVIDTKPRKLTAEEKELLLKLGKLSTSLIELRLSHNKYKKLVEFTGDMIYEMDGDGRFIFVNQSTEKTLGYSLNELRKMTCWDLLVPDEKVKGLKTYAREVQEKKPCSYHEFTVISKAGKLVKIGQTVDFEYDGDRIAHAYVVSKDITELKQTQSFLKESEEKYRLVSEGSHDIICLHHTDGSYAYVSGAVNNLLGYSPEELIGRSVYDLIHPEEHQMLQQKEHQAVLDGKSVDRFEYRLQHKSGHYVWMESYAKPIFDDNHQLKFIQSSSRDISRRKQKEMELEHANMLLEKYKVGLQTLNTLSTTPRTNFYKALKKGLQICRSFLGMDMILITDVNPSQQTFRITEWDQVDDQFDLSRSLDYPLANTLTNIAFEKEGPWAVNDLSKTGLSQLQELTKYGIKSQISCTYFVKEHKKGTINLLAKEPRTEEFTKYELDFLNLFARWAGDLVYKDESDRQLLAEQHILRAFVLSAPAAIAMFDVNVHYLAASSKWYKDFRIERNIIGKSFYEIFPEISEDWKTIHQKCLTGEVIKSNEDKFERADGSIQWIRWEVRPWHNLKGEIGGMIMSTDDITTMKNQALELEAAKEIAEASSKTKENFLSTMSHEIRTPLNAIIGTTRLLSIENPELNDNERFKLLEFSSANLLSLINDVLDFNKINSGKLELDSRPVDLKESIVKLVNTWVPTAKQKDIALKLEIPDIRLPVNADAVRINQILNNLISNAIKFTDEGLVKIVVSPEPAYGSRTVVSFEVKDTGRGIPKEHLSIIFESFHQVVNGKEENLGGTGLGLSITKQLIELMGGHISVTSEVGWGSSFYFTLDLENTQLQEKTFEIKDNLSDQGNVKVLVVDDNIANQSIATGFLSKWGIHSSVANNGREAVEKVSNEHFDLVLMDLRMPIMDGYEAAQHIRKLQGPQSAIPIIALTASTMLEVKQKIRAAGMNDYLSKPFDPEDLLNKINTNIQIHIQSQSPKEANQPQWKYLSELFDNDEEKINMMLEVSIESIENALDKLKKGIKGRDVELIGDALHTIKPNLGHLDLNELANKVPYKDASNFYVQIEPWIDQVTEKITTVKSALTA